MMPTMVTAALFLVAPALGTAVGGDLPSTTTVIVHGYSPNEKGAWVQGLAAAVIGRTQGVGSVYRYTGATGEWTLVPDAGGDGSAKHVVLIFNWVPESDGPDAGPNWNYAQAAGDALVAMLRDPAYGAGRPGPSDLLGTGEGARAVHFIGHSRGACVISEAILRLALADISVDQMTTHDPHPVNGTLDARYNFNWGDPVPVRWSNVSWADNFWRADGGGLINGLDFDGTHLDHAFNTNLSESALNCCGYSFAHSDVHLWYHGTVDLSANPSDGEQTITNQMRATWWPQGYTQRGFYYSAIGGGAADRPAIDAGVDPPTESAPSVWNGAFEQGSRAGWLHHGGGGGAIIQSGSNWFVRLSSSNSTITHNRAFLPEQPLMLSMKLRRIGAAATDDIVRIAMQREEDAQPVPIAAALWPVSTLTTAFAEVDVSVPAQFRGRTLRLSITLDGGAGSIDSQIEIDDVVITPGGMIGDFNGDTMVDGDDLGSLLGAWGPCPGCSEDLTGDGVVDGDDLGSLLGGWTG